MLDKLLTLAADPAAEADLRRLAAEQVRSLRASAGRGDCGQVAQAEDAVRADPWDAFTFDGDGFATLSVGEHTWQAGRFELPSIAELRERAAAPASGVPGVSGARLWVLDGASPATDVGGLQATAGERALFQVASQFNCLESPGPFITPVSKYFHDLTQGPRASVSAFPATLLRHYTAPRPHGKRFVQTTGGKQIDLLADVFGRGESPVCNGYLLGGKEATMVAALEAGFEKIRVGVHDGAQVVLGYNWDGAVEGPGTRRVT